MRHKRINHQVDAFCDMFSGWRLANDRDTLIQLGQGQLEFDLLEKTVKLNGEHYNGNFNVLFEITHWFERDLTENNIEKKFIKKAALIVDFKTTVSDGRSKSRTKKITEIKLAMKSSIQTDEKEYSAMQDKTVEYHFIVNKRLSNIS